MTPLQAMKQALAALEPNRDEYSIDVKINLRTAIAEMEKAEPVGMVSYSGNKGAYLFVGQDLEDDTPLYTHPQTIPEGWQLVPKEPAEEMCLAGQDHAGCIGVYKAMLAAAPKPEDKP